MGCRLLLQGIFLTQQSNPYLLHLLLYRRVLYHWAPRKALPMSTLLKQCSQGGRIYRQTHVCEDVSDDSGHGTSQPLREPTVGQEFSTRAAAVSADIMGYQTGDRDLLASNGWWPGKVLSPIYSAQHGPSQGRLWPQRG